MRDFLGGDEAENAQALRDVLAGGAQSDAKRDAVVLNAGVGLYVYGLAASIGDGVALARRVLESGAAVTLLDKWIAKTQALVES